VRIISDIKIVGISVDKRTKSAPVVQQVLTKFGDNIISRYGVHDVGEHERGLITLNFVGGNESLNQLESELSNLDGVIVKSINLE
jgi:hypothetical protein